jgi:hypothetical protein
LARSFQGGEVVLRDHGHGVNSFLFVMRSGTLLG